MTTSEVTPPPHVYFELDTETGIGICYTEPSEVRSFSKSSPEHASGRLAISGLMSCIEELFLPESNA